MKISNTGPTGPTSKSSKKSSTSGSSSAFSSHLGKASGGGDAPVDFQELSPMASMDSILSLQEVNDATDEERKRQLYQRGEDILDELAKIQKDILSGALPQERLQNLSVILRGKRDMIDDPKLQNIIDEIELRAQVEIAKWEKNL